MEGHSCYLNGCKCVASVWLTLLVNNMFLAPGEHTCVYLAVQESTQRAIGVHREAFTCVMGSHAGTCGRAICEYGYVHFCPWLQNYPG